MPSYSCLTRMIMKLVLGVFLITGCTEKRIGAGGPETEGARSPLVAAINTDVAGAPQQEVVEVVDLHFLSDSLLVLADRDRLYEVSSSTGNVLRSYGRKGSGPGEFQRIQWASVVNGDSTVIYDVLASRLTVVAPNFSGTRTKALTLSTPAEAVRPACALGSEELAVLTQPRANGPAPDGLAADSANLQIVDVSDGGFRDLGVSRPRPRWYAVVNAGGQPVRVVIPVPFAPGSIIRCVGGRLYWADGSEPRIYSYRSGIRSEVHLRTLPRIDVSQIARDHVVDSASAAHGGGPLDFDMGAVVSAAMEAGAYNLMPYFVDLRIGTDGTIWALSPLLSGESKKMWYAFSSDGTPISTEPVILDFDLLAVSSSKLWGMTLGTFDEPILVGQNRDGLFGVR